MLEMDIVDIAVLRLERKDVMQEKLARPYLTMVLLQRRGARRLFGRCRTGSASARRDIEQQWLANMEDTYIAASLRADGTKLRVAMAPKLPVRSSVLLAG